ncbi:esterase/lipase family protein [Gordonia lacunae]|uniref:Alpha/beta hydrolase n=1 Tax=Gordonia lacunae TaxID=417102 RepID=A0A243Q6T9_9ACTN|nr:alpha/beta fold hydrolase [Gordonia lacunae]OUC77184.1 alpha/beta hydrolase [Gordonia lacunae]
MTASTTRESELRALTDLGLYEAGAATRGVGAMHRVIAGGVFRMLRPVLGGSVDTARMVHDAVSEGAYNSITAALDAGRSAADHVPWSEGRAPSQTARGAVLLGILNGLIGDELETADSPLTADMSVRVDGRPVSLDAESLREGLPDAGGHVVVFLHGLMESEFAWSLSERPTYGERLARDIGATEVQLRYNTGRHISENGRALADLLDALVLLWPTPVTRLSLIGHSMGGLVVRSACHAADQRGDYWPGLVSETVCLGTPHLGAPLARGVHLATNALRRTPVTRPIGSLLRRRSAGVRDLFHGSLTDDDWIGHDPDAWSQPPGADVPLLKGARHLFVTATITRDPDHPVGRLFGDGLVLAPSGRGQHTRQRRGLRFHEGFHIGNAHHFTLLNSDAIYDWLRGHLTPRRQLPPGRSS